MNPIWRVMVSPCLSAASICFSIPPIPAGDLGLPCGWLTAGGPADPIGVSTFGMREIRSGWVSPMRRGLWWFALRILRFLRPDATRYHHSNQGLMTWTNGTYTEIHLDR